MRHSGCCVRAWRGLDPPGPCVGHSQAGRGHCPSEQDHMRSPVVGSHGQVAMGQILPIMESDFCLVSSEQGAGNPRCDGYHSAIPFAISHGNPEASFMDLGWISAAPCVSWGLLSLRP